MLFAGVIQRGKVDRRKRKNGKQRLNIIGDEKRRGEDAIIRRRMKQKPN